MKKRQFFCCAACCLFLLLVSPAANAVDSSRASTQLQSAPSWAKTPTTANSNAAFGYGATAIAPSRSRTGNAPLPQWSDPTQPSFDPRLTRPLDPALSPPSYGQSAPQKWRLGIYPENTNTGVTVREVVRGSAAERAGLEVNDRIVAAHGYQVGYVDGVLYDIGQEFERLADANGWIQVLVQDSRNGKLMNLPIKLDGRSEALSGTITYRDRATLPQDAVATVELREIVRSDIRPITLARQTVSGVRTPPIQFSLNYDPTQIDPSRTYVLHASIDSQGREIYGMQRDVAVLGSNPSNNLQLFVESTTYPGGTTVPNQQQQMAQITQWFRTYLGREPRRRNSMYGRPTSIGEGACQMLSCRFSALQSFIINAMQTIRNTYGECLSWSPIDNLHRKKCSSGSAV